MMVENRFDCIVVGGGPTGLMSALALEKAGLTVALVAPQATAPAARTTALFETSLELPRRLGLEDELNAIGEPLAVMRLIDDTGSFIQAPEVSFRACEVDRPHFGLNIANAKLTEVLDQAVGKKPNIERHQAPATGIDYEENAVVVHLETGAILQAEILVAADGRRSFARERAGIGTRGWSLPQTALVLLFEHSRAHENVSTEFHRPYGPFTQVPLDHHVSSLVWVEKPDVAERLLALEVSDLERKIELISRRLFGSVKVVEKPSAYPLSTLVAKRFADKKTFLVGEAAHAFAPIGAQGLNLGVRDVSDLARILGRAKSTNDLANEAVQKRYHDQRTSDVWVRTLGVEALNRSLITRSAIMPVARGLLLTAAERITPFRRLMMHHGMAAKTGIAPYQTGP